MKMIIKRRVDLVTDNQSAMDARAWHGTDVHLCKCLQLQCNAAGRRAFTSNDVHSGWGIAIGWTDTDCR